LSDFLVLGEIAVRTDAEFLRDVFICPRSVECEQDPGNARKHAKVD